MIKRVIVYNNMAQLKPNTEVQYYDYFMFIEPGFKKTFYTLFNNVDVPVSDQDIMKRVSYYNEEVGTIISALNKAGVHNENFIASISVANENEEPTLEEYNNQKRLEFLKEIMALYLINYEHDGRFQSQEFQTLYFSRIEQLYELKDMIVDFPDEYNFIFQYLVRKLLWYYTTIIENRDTQYLNGNVDNLLTYILSTDEWYNNYNALAVEGGQESTGTSEKVGTVNGEAS